MNDVATVVIGRNEAPRLGRALASASGAGLVVYVDSGSTDGSAAVAAAAGIRVLALDRSAPFTAARARNEGVALVARLQPGTRFVQFLDGDSVLVPGWVVAARAALEAAPDAGLVCGRLREHDPGASVYNAVCDLEWDAPVGDVEASGGICMIRLDAFRAAGGFDPRVAAGEEPELCARLRARGWRVVRLPQAMAAHDAALAGFGAWWRREVRNGQGALAFRDTLFRHQVRSVRRWTVGWALGVATAIAAGVLVDARLGAVLGLAVAAAIPCQMARLALAARRRGAGLKVAAGYGVLTMVGKWAQLEGHVRAGRGDRMAPAPSPAPADDVVPRRVAGR